MPETSTGLVKDLCQPWGAEDRMVLAFHGGGIVTGSMYTHRRLFGHLGRAVGGRALVIDYRRAPGHTHPDMFLGESGNPRDPFVSPLYVGLTGLPPLDIQAWSDETLLDDSSHPAAGVPGTGRRRPGHHRARRSSPASEAP